jgi:hypothetical protein
MSARGTGLALLACCALLAGCVSGQWTRARAHREVRLATLEGLAPGAELGACLDALGAPNDVWEAPDGGAALAWWWVDARGWGLTASVPLHDSGSASATWMQADAPGRGVVLFFDDELRLARWRLGGLAGAAERGRRRPAPAPSVQAEDQAEGGP